MDTYPSQNQTSGYTEHDVTALLNEHGGRLYWYFWLMLGDETAVSRALASTVIVALPDLGPRELFGTARKVSRQYPPISAMPYARAEAPTLAAATRAALRRLTPADREICVLSAPVYRLDDAALGAVFGTWEVEDLLSRPMAGFSGALMACAADAGLEQDEDLVTRAWRLVGAGQVSLPYDEIVALATDPAAEWAREGIRARFGAEAVKARQSGGMELLGTGPQQAIKVTGVPERLTLPLAPAPRKSGEHGSHRRRGATMAGTALVAGAIPVALAVAWAGHSTQPTTQHVASPPLSAAAPGASDSGGAHVAPGGSDLHPGKPGGYAGKHARPGSGSQQAAQPGGGSANVNAAAPAGGSGGAAPAPATYNAPPTTTTTTTTPPPTTTTTPPPTTTTPPPTTTTPPPPVTTTPPPVTTTTHGNGNGNGGVGMGKGNGNTTTTNGNGGVGNANGNGTVLAG